MKNKIELKRDKMTDTDYVTFLVQRYGIEGRDVGGMLMEDQAEILCDMKDELLGTGGIFCDLRASMGDAEYTEDKIEEVKNSLAQGLVTAFAGALFLKMRGQWVTRNDPLNILTGYVLEAMEGATSYADALPNPNEVTDADVLSQLDPVLKEHYIKMKREAKSLEDKKKKREIQDAEIRAQMEHTSSKPKSNKGKEKELIDFDDAGNEVGGAEEEGIVVQGTRRKKAMNINEINKAKRMAAEKAKITGPTVRLTPGGPSASTGAAGARRPVPAATGLRRYKKK